MLDETTVKETRLIELECLFRQIQEAFGTIKPYQYNNELLAEVKKRELIDPQILDNLRLEQQIKELEQSIEFSKNKIADLVAKKLNQ